MRGGLAAALAVVLFITLLPIPLAPAQAAAAPKHVPPGRMLMPVAPGTNALPFINDGPQAISVQPARAQEKLLVLLVQFSDTSATTSPSAINGLIFSTTPGDHSLVNYYKENSYGKTTVSGVVYPTTGWLAVGHPMSYYGADSSTGIDDLNGPVYRLVTDAVNAAQASGFTNFKQFDTDGDGVVDHIMVVHAGQGQETSSANTNLIWSHRWAVLDSDLSRPGDQPLMTSDGTRVYGYFMTSEYSPVGVFSHEFGHDFGLPDLYDTDGSSQGIGVWDIMSSGSWNGNPRGSDPSEFSAWSKVKLGWVNPTIVTLPMVGAPLPQVETSPSVYKLPIKSSSQGDEYFLVENRERAGFDTDLPGGGVLIWHIDDSMGDNTNDQHRLVSLENADYGLWGDTPNRASNAWTSSDAGFTPTSVPNSNGYGNVPTNWMVKHISAAGASMTADISQEVAYDVGIADLTRTPFVAANGVEVLTTRVVNKGALNVTVLPVNITIYKDTYGGVPVARSTTILPILLSGRSTNVTYSYNVTARGKYIVEATADLATDEVPQDNFRIVHFTAVAWVFRDTVEAGTNGWTSSAGVASQYQWSIVAAGGPNGAAFSPTHSWRFGYTQNPPLPVNQPYYTLTSSSIAIAGATPHLAFFQRYDLTGRVGNVSGLASGVPLQPIDTDTATVQVSFDGGPFQSVGQFRGTQLAWGLFYFDLTPIAPPGATALQIRFNSTAGLMPTDGGWWVDDVMVLQDPLRPGLVARAVMDYGVVPPGGRTLYPFAVVNVGDTVQATSFQVQLPSGWTASLGYNDSVLVNPAAFSVYAPVDTPLVLILGVSAPFLVERGAKVQGVLTATGVNTTATASFTFTAEVGSGFGLSLNERTLILGAMVAAMLVVLTIVVEEVRKRRHRRVAIPTLRPPLVPPGRP